VSLISNFIGPAKVLKMGKSIYKAVKRGVSAYKKLRKIINAARRRSRSSPSWSTTATRVELPNEWLKQLGGRIARRKPGGNRRADL